MRVVRSSSLRRLSSGPRSRTALTRCGCSARTLTSLLRTALPAPTLEEFLSADEAKKNAGRMRDKSHPSHVLAKERYQALRREIFTRFPGTDAEALGSRTLNGQVWLKPEATVAWMYAVTQRLGGTISDRAAQGIYGFLSNMTHPTLYPARQRREWIDDPEAGQRVAYLRVDVGSREDEARAALAAFYNALTYVTDYFGWPNEVLDDLTVKIEETIPTFFL